jgi:tRNA-dihydrouridine synthase
MAAEFDIDPRGAAIEFRKHLGWYVKGMPDSADLRKKLYAVESVSEIESIFGAYLASHPDASVRDDADEDRGDVAAAA